MTDKQDKRLPTPEETHSMEQLIISAMTNDGEYPVDDVGEHAAQIARVLIFNGYRQETELAKIDKLKLDRPELREKIAKVQRCLRNCNLYPYLCRKCAKCKVGCDLVDYEMADQLLAIIPDEEEIRGMVLREVGEKLEAKDRFLERDLSLLLPDAEYVRVTMREIEALKQGKSPEGG